MKQNVLAALLVLAPVGVNAGPEQLCYRAIKHAARQTDVPESVLTAIAVTETGRGQNGQRHPWPWAINVAGQGYWAQGEQELRQKAQHVVADGKSNFDLGCFQLNYRWHGDKFQSISDMIDPDTNALYAARMLSALYQEFGNWSDAAGAYHSRTEVHATRYQDKFEAAWAEVTEAAPIPVQTAPRTPGSLFSAVRFR